MVSHKKWFLVVATQIILCLELANNQKCYIFGFTNREKKTWHGVNQLTLWFTLCQTHILTHHGEPRNYFPIKPICYLTLS